VEGAWLDNGLLHVDLRRPQPEVRVKTIPIGGAAGTDGTVQSRNGNGAVRSVVEGRTTRG
jgi:hypothetical protein